MNFKYYLYIGLLILLILVGIKLNSCHNSTNISTILEKPKFENIITHTSKTGSTVAAIPQITYTSKDMKILTDSIKKLNNIKGKVHEVISYIDRVDTVIPAGYVKYDSLSGSISAIQEGRYDTIAFLGNSRTNTGTFSLKLTNDTITTIQTFKRHLFGHQTDSISILHSNPLFKTTMGESYTIREKKPIWTISAYIGEGYIPKYNSFLPSIGISLNRVIFVIKSK